RAFLACGHSSALLCSAGEGGDRERTERGDRDEFKNRKETVAEPVATRADYMCSCSYMCATCHMRSGQVHAHGPTSEPAGAAGAGDEEEDEEEEEEDVCTARTLTAMCFGRTCADTKSELARPSEAAADAEDVDVVGVAAAATGVLELELELVL